MYADPAFVSGGPSFETQDSEARRSLEVGQPRTPSRTAACLVMIGLALVFVVLGADQPGSRPERSTAGTRRGRAHGSLGPGFRLLGA